MSYLFHDVMERVSRGQRLVGVTGSPGSYRTVLLNTTCLCSRLEQLSSRWWRLHGSRSRRHLRNHWRRVRFSAIWLCFANHVAASRQPKPLRTCSLQIGAFRQARHSRCVTNGFPVRYITFSGQVIGFNVA